jgi:hypothetical protein
VDTPRPSPRTNRTRRVPHPVLIGHAAVAADTISEDVLAAMRQLVDTVVGQMGGGGPPLPCAPPPPLSSWFLAARAAPRRAAEPSAEAPQRQPGGARKPAAGRLCSRCALAAAGADALSCAQGR